MEENVKVPSTGAIPSEPDYRDAMVSGSVLGSIADDIAAGTLPESFMTDISALGEALDQNKINACVSHAWALVMKYYWYKKTGVVIDFSPRFLDIMSKEDWIPIDGGRVPRTVCKVSVKYGCCTTALLPNNTETSHAEYRGAEITQAMLDEAAKYKLPGYIRIPDNSVSDFRNAIKQFGLVSGLFGISDSFWVPSWFAKDIDPLQARTPTSNHQMVVRGWAGYLNRLRNSWSKDWDIEGEGNFKASTWLNYIIEGWAVATVPADLAAFMSSLPAPSAFHYQWNKDLAAGDANDDVKMAQIALMVLGLMQPVAPDQLGIYGAKTAQAVLKYQALKKIAPNMRNAYRIGPLTRGFLNAEFAL